MDPITLSQEIEERYLRYLKTTFHFRDPVLRGSFEQALNSGHLSKGPYLEATPVFRQAQTPRSLFPGLLGAPCEEGFLQALQADRPLYQHQEQAVRRVAKGRNIIVATGTGSGKTEAFLLPILLHLYRERQAGKLCPGVRALILYPMNALANDQRERLADICKRLEEAKSHFRFTFGQYIGETPEDEKDTYRHAQDHIAHRLPGELVTRAEIRSHPPHILLTNYSMLEYLLLRPADSPLFDHGQARWWTFLVLDEAHQYRGSRGIEMAMLLRRFKQRLKEGGRLDPFRCIATSATLVGGESDKEAVARFAANLFGEEFQEQDVILGDVESIAPAGPKRLAPNDYTILRGVLDNASDAGKSELLQLAQRQGVMSPNSGAPPQLVGEILVRDRRSAELRQFIRGGPRPVSEIATQAFGDLPPADRLAALSQQVDLLLRARDPACDAPLLSARYHLFLRSLEGAFVQFFPEKKVLLDRSVANGENAVFEIALCRECGQHYLVAQKNFRSGKVAEAIRDPGHEHFGATFLLPLEGDVDGAAGEDNADDDQKEVFQLCLKCGEMSKSVLRCGHSCSIRVIRAPSHEEERADQIKKCLVCGYNAAGRDPVREVIYGADGPHAVIATTLHQKLERKKVLAFSDSRQEAAFFAWYLDRSYRDLLSRSTFLHVAQSFTRFPDEGIGLRTIADRSLQKYSEAYKEQQSDDELAVRKNIWRALYREFLTEEQRLSLEGVGLVRWSVGLPDWFKVPNILHDAPWHLTESEARDLIFVLLDTMRYTRAVELETDEDIPLTWKELGFQGLPKVFHLGNPGGRTDSRSWDGKQGKRARLLTKLLEGQVPEEQRVDHAVRALREIWEALRQCDENAPSPRDRFFVTLRDGCRINPLWWRLRLVREEDPLYQCTVCGQVQTISVRGVCVKHHCPGTLKRISPSELGSNHYRSLYLENLPNSLVVEEHTAQLDHVRAREFQRDFREGRIHLLSCSTTFELGVDLGDLETAFLRNVPPESFNYAQRAGRVGRRSGHPGFAITYCRRNPHDLYHFADPRQMLAGKVQPPVLSLSNEKILTRHLVATALSEFFLQCPQRFPNVKAFCGNVAKPTIMSDFRLFLKQSRPALEKSLRAIVPTGMVDQVGLRDGGWMDRVAGDASQISLAVSEVASDYDNAEHLRAKAYQSRDDRTVKWAGDRARTIESEDVLSFLSRRAVIPKYGFPVDVVELDTQRTFASQDAFDVLLQRDLAIAISEFAPTSQLVANKKVWTSYALKRVVEKEWERWWYARCLVHARFERKPYSREQEPPSFEKCCERMSVTLQYIEPRFGFITNRDRPKEPIGRPSRVFTTRPYFVGFKEKPGEPLERGAVTLTKVSPGYMVVVCEGQHGEGFYICSQCGAGFRNRTEFKKGHLSPYGEKCPASTSALKSVALGHELVTDVLKLQFRMPVSARNLSWFAFSLGYALVEGAAEVLDVPAADLNATVAYTSVEPVPPIVLYDNVPGGAGLVARLEDESILRECLQAARERVSGNCGCGEETSCYGCLRNYRNQFAHHNLQRGPVLRYLETVLSSMG